MEGTAAEAVEAAAAEVNAEAAETETEAALLLAMDGMSSSAVATLAAIATVSA